MVANETLDPELSPVPQALVSENLVMNFIVVVMGGSFPPGFFLMMKSLKFVLHVVHLNRTFKIFFTEITDDILHCQE